MPMPAGCSAPCRSFGQPLLPNASSVLGSPMPRPSLSVIRPLARSRVMATDVAPDRRAFWRISWSACVTSRRRTASPSRSPRGRSWPGWSAACCLSWLLLPAGPLSQVGEGSVDGRDVGVEPAGDHRGGGARLPPPEDRRGEPGLAEHAPAVGRPPGGGHSCLLPVWTQGRVPLSPSWSCSLVRT